MRGFLHNACSMLHIDGEVHVNHKTTAPFDSWKIEELGYEFSLVCTAQDEFRIADYRGYNNKRGSGSRADEPFPLGPCKTYRFRLSPLAVNNLLMRKLHSLQQQTPVAYGNGAALQNYGSECRRIFSRYLKHVDETFGDTSYDVRASVEEALRFGYEVYMGNGRHSGGFISILEELHNLSIVRSEQLRQMLRHDQS